MLLYLHLQSLNKYVQAYSDNVLESPQVLGCSTKSIFIQVSDLIPETGPWIITIYQKPKIVFVNQQPTSRLLLCKKCANVHV